MLLLDLQQGLPWFEKAAHDIRAIEILLDADEYPSDIVCIHAQQAVEKAIKGLLASSSVEPLKTHDLVKLASTLPPELQTEVITKAALDLTDYATTSRYPDSIRELDFEEAESAAVRAKEAVATILALFPQEA